MQAFGNFLVLIFLSLVELSSSDGEVDYRVKLIPGAGNCENYEQYPVRWFNYNTRFFDDGSVTSDFNFIVTVPVDDTMAFYPTMYYQPTAGAPKTLFLKAKMPKACSTIRQFRFGAVSDFANAGGIQLECPLKTGNYTIQNYKITVTKFPTHDKLKPGIYSGTLEIKGKGGELITCEALVFEAIPV